jgi:CBS domain-containing protein
MRVREILHMKNTHLVMISSRAPVREASLLISSERIGMLLVIDDHENLIGLLSERDIICFVATEGAEALARPVQAAMSEVRLVATPEDSVTDVMRTMTNQRVRHMPVMSQGQLVGVISIGDILKSRLAEKDQETAVLRDIARVSLAAAA